MDLTLYFITDSTGFSDEEFFGRVEEAVHAGVSMVQLREKNISTRKYYEKALKLKRICSESGVPLIINDRLDIALAVNADGVHLGTDDMPIHTAREILGDGKIIGATAKTVARAASAQMDGADYFGIGAFFATDTKPDALVLTPGEVLAVTDSVKIPAVAIGGLNSENIPIIGDCGVRGAAVSNVIMRSDNITLEVWRLKREIARTLNIGQNKI